LSHKVRASTTLSSSYSDTNPRSNGQFSKRETHSYHRIPQRVRLVPLDADWYRNDQNLTRASDTREIAQESATSSSVIPKQGAASIDMKLVWLLTIATGMTVANLFYSQPLLPMIAHSFALSSSQASLIGTLTLLGYAFGLALIVPLGDNRERRS